MTDEQNRLMKRLEDLGGASDGNQVGFFYSGRWSAAVLHDGELRHATGASPPRPALAKVPLFRPFLSLIHQLHTKEVAFSAAKGKVPREPRAWLKPFRAVGYILLYLFGTGILFGMLDAAVVFSRSLFTPGEGLLSILGAPLAAAIVWAGFGVFLSLTVLVPSARTTYRMHAAEHKMANAFQTHGPDWSEAADDAPKEHIRCGTNVVPLLLMLSTLVDGVIAYWISGPAIRMVVFWLYLMPVYALGLQLLKWPRTQRIAGAPGFILQQFTTLQPNQQHMDLARAAFKPIAEQILRDSTKPTTHEDRLATRASFDEYGPFSHN